MNFRRSRRGFTLLEVLISITILALMALMISRIFSESTRAIERGKGQVLLDETARLLLDYIEQDVSQALIRTNVAFRVHDEDGADALYFISTATRRHLETIPRDTAPMRWQSTPITDWNQHVSIWSPDDSAGTTPNTLQNLIRHSDYYYSRSGQTAPDFQPIHGSGNNVTFKGEYTQPLEAETGSHAMLTFMDIEIYNEQVSLTYDSIGQPDPANMPRFVDVAIGLTASTDMEQAMRLRNAQGDSTGSEYIENHERIYTRRIFMRNTGIDQLTF